MTIGISQERPHPYQLEVGDPPVGVMLLMTDAGELTGRKAEGLERVIPTEQEYASLPAFVERPFSFDRLTQGMGERVLSAWTSKRYKHALGVDCSIGGLPFKGPLFHVVTPGTTGPVGQFVDALHGGVLTQFVLAGQYALRRASDVSYVLSLDAGAGITLNQGVRFKFAGGAPVDGLYVAASNGALREYDGAAWASAALPVGFSPEFVETVGDELRAGGGNQVRVVTADPKVALNWGGPITVGDGSARLTWIKQVANQTLYFKENGVYSISVDGAGVVTDNDLYPDFRASRAATNGRNAHPFRDALWFRFGDRFYRVAVGDTAEREQVGPERLLEYDGEVRGLPVCSADHAGFLYLGLYNPGNGASYLLKFGAWETPTDAPGGAGAAFAEVWHGALKKWTGKEITAMAVSSVPGPNERLYCGFADGTIEWCWLPKGTPNPTVDPVCEFSDPSEAGELHWPDNHFTFQGEDKAWRGIGAFGPRLDAANWVTHEYRLTSGGTWLKLGTETVDGDKFDQSGERVNFPDGTASKVIQQVTKLRNAATTATPVLEGMILFGAVRPLVKLQYSPTIMCRNHVARLDGSVDWRTAEQLRAAVRAAADTPGAVRFRLPDHTAVALSVIDYAEVQLKRPDRYGLGWDVSIDAVVFQTLTVYGTIERLEGFLIGDLGPYTIETLATI